MSPSKYESSYYYHTFLLISTAGIQTKVSNIHTTQKGKLTAHYTSSGMSDSAPLLTSWKSFCTLSRAVINDGRTVVANELRRWDAGNKIL